MEVKYVDIFYAHGRMGKSGEIKETEIKIKWQIRESKS